MDYFWNAVRDIVVGTFEFTADMALEFFNVIIGVLPSSDGFPTEVDTSFALLGEQLSLLNYFVPVDTIVTMIGLFVLLQLATIIYKLSWRLFGMFRGVNMSPNTPDFTPDGGSDDYVRPSYQGGVKFK